MGESDEDISVSPYPSAQFVPKLLYWGQILTVWWPIQWDHVMVSQKVYDKLWLRRAGHYHAVKSFDCCIRGTTTGRKTLSLYLTVKLPAITIKCDFTAWEMPPQTKKKKKKTLPNLPSRQQQSVPLDVGKRNVDCLSEEEWNGNCQ